MATDPQLRRTLIDSLSQDDFEVLHEANGGYRVADILDMNPQVIVISEDSPVLGGLEHLALVRRVTSAPVIIVGKEEDIRVISALVNGADMYVRTPVIAGSWRAAFGRWAGDRETGLSFGSPNPTSRPRWTISPMTFVCPLPARSLVC